MRPLNPQSALEKLVFNAKQGHADAQCDLGYRYASGTGVEKDLEEAACWFHKAAEQAYPEAQYSLGFRYANGIGVTQDREEAVKWYRRAAEQGHAIAQFNLDVCCANAVEANKVQKAKVICSHSPAAPLNGTGVFTEVEHSEKAQDAISDEKTTHRDFYAFDPDQRRKLIQWGMQNIYEKEMDNTAARHCYQEDWRFDVSTRESMLGEIIAEKAVQLQSPPKSGPLKQLWDILPACWRKQEVTNFDIDQKDKPAAVSQSRPWISTAIDFIKAALLILSLILAVIIGGLICFGTGPAGLLIFFVLMSGIGSSHGQRTRRKQWR